MQPNHAEVFLNGLESITEGRRNKVAEKQQHQLVAHPPDAYILLDLWGLYCPLAKCNPRSTCHVGILAYDKRFESA